MSCYMSNSKVNVHTRVKRPAYPLHVLCQAKLGNWKNYRSGTIIIDGAGKIGGLGYYSGIKTCEPGFEPYYFFVSELTGSKYSLSPGIGVVKTKDGKIWNPTLTWYSPKKSKRCDGPWIITPVPGGWPTSYEEALDGEQLIVS